LRVVGQVHRHLRLAIHEQTERLDEPQAAGLVPNGAGDFAGNFYVGRRQVHVEGDQRGACADHGRAGRAEFRRAVVRTALGIG